MASAATCKHHRQYNSGCHHDSLMTYLSLDHLSLVLSSQRGQISYAFAFFKLSNRRCNSSCVWTRVFVAAERGESVGQFSWSPHFVFPLNSPETCSVDIIVPCIRSCVFVEIERGKFAGSKIQTIERCQTMAMAHFDGTDEVGC